MLRSQAEGVSAAIGGSLDRVGFSQREPVLFQQQISLLRMDHALKINFILAEKNCVIRKSGITILHFQIIGS